LESQLGLCSTVLGKEGKKIGAEAKARFPREHLWRSHIGRDHCLIVLEQVFTCFEPLLLGNTTSKFQ